LLPLDPSRHRPIRIGNRILPEPIRVEDVLEQAWHDRIGLLAQHVGIPRAHALEVHRRGPAQVGVPPCQQDVTCLELLHRRGH